MYELAVWIKMFHMTFSPSQYNFPTVVGWRESHVEHFDPNG